MSIDWLVAKMEQFCVGSRVEEKNAYSHFPHKLTSMKHVADSFALRQHEIYHLLNNDVGTFT